MAQAAIAVGGRFCSPSDWREAKATQPSSRATGVRIKTSEDLASGKVQAFFQVDDEVVNRIGRRRWCIEYSTFGQFTQAIREFQSALRSFDRVEVVETGHCVRR